MTDGLRNSKEGPPPFKIEIWTHTLQLQDPTTLSTRSTPKLNSNHRLADQYRGTAQFCRLAKLISYFPTALKPKSWRIHCYTTHTITNIKTTKTTNNKSTWPQKTIFKSRKREKSKTFSIGSSYLCLGTFPLAPSLFLRYPPHNHITHTSTCPFHSIPLQL